MYSDNGWRGIENPADLRTITVIDVGKFRVAPGCAWIFEQFIGRFDRKVERLKGPVFDDWSYNYRPVRGTTSHLSCHASGTAVDLNAVKHFRGRKNTFTPKAFRALRELLAEFRDPETGISVIKWGGDFKSPSIVDEMHFQIHGDRAALARVQKNLEDDVTPQDKKDIIDGVFKKLTTEKFIPNRALSPEDKDTYFTLAGVLANIETNDDQLRRTLYKKLEDLQEAVDKCLKPPAQ